MGCMRVHLVATVCTAPTLLSPSGSPPPVRTLPCSGPSQPELRPGWSSSSSPTSEEAQSSSLQPTRFWTKLLIGDFYISCFVLSTVQEHQTKQTIQIKVKNNSDNLDFLTKDCCETFPWTSNDHIKTWTYDFICSVEFVSQSYKKEIK